MQEEKTVGHVRGVV